MIQSIESLKPIYYPSECCLDSELFLPITESATRLRCMVGYFTSGSLSELARSLACFLRINSDSTMQFCISPNLPEDEIEAVKKAVSYDENLLPLLFPGYEISEKSLKSDSVTALAYLVASKRLKIKIAVMSDGLFHSKCWIFNTEAGLLAVHGSGNATRGGLASNFEQLVLSRSWRDADSDYICRDLEKKFTEIWNGVYSSIECFDLNKNTLLALQKVHDEQSVKQPLTPANIADLLLNHLNQAESCDENEVGIRNKLRIPDWLNYSSGSFSHQGEAVKEWFSNDFQGIFSIATGGGKTLTSLIGATLLNNEVETLFVVVAVPTTALLSQWAEDVIHFGVKPINTNKINKNGVIREVNSAFRKLRMGISESEVIIITHDNLRENFKDILYKFEGSVPMLLIGDEVHNLGSMGFQKNAPTSFTHKLGLSATYERQFDEDGTSFLLEYFGDVVFDYPLSQAIGNCLVPFDYYVHQVLLTAEEEDEFSSITFQIKKISYAAHFKDGDATKERWKMLCLKRRRLIECAENKISVFKRIFPYRSDDVDKTIIFCTDKYPEQLNQINSIMHERSINFHQVTSDETSNPRMLANIVDSFKSGDLQVLTSKRVLDEGFNVPQTETAYLVASNTVRRQWIQRLGRVLRLSSSTGKEKAIIHDFMVVPAVTTDSVDDDLQSLLEGEYNRLNYFCSLSSNGTEPDGALYKINRLLELIKK